MALVKERIILVTGSTDGIGKQTALELARSGAHVIIHGRNSSRASSALKDIRKTTGNKNLDCVAADFSSFTQIHAMSRDLKAKYGRLHALINNAGVVQKSRILTEDGIESTFAVNHLAPFLLTYLLLDLLKNGEPSRIINVASMAHASIVDFSNLQGEKQYDGYQAYALSKLGNIVFTYGLAERLRGSGVSVNCLHPGVINTKLLRTTFSGGSPVTEGAKTPVYLALSPDVEGVTGRYFVDRRETRSAPVTYDTETRRKLWEISEHLTGITWEGA